RFAEICLARSTAWRTASDAVSEPSVPTTIDLNTRSPLVVKERARSYASVIDLHCHILPGVDDGPPTLDETLALARTQVAAGVRQVLATPHVTWDIPTTSRQVAEGVAAVNAALREAELPLEVLPGGEIAITRAADLDDDEL